MTGLIVILDFLSRAIALILAVGALVWFAFRRWVTASIDARFKRNLDAELETLKHQFATSLAEKNADLGRQAAAEIETLKNRLAHDLDQDKRRLDEQSRKESRIDDRTLAYYETFDGEYGRVLSELWALQTDFTAPLNSIDPELGRTVRGLFVSRAHATLMQANEKLAADSAHIDVFLHKRIAELFAALSAFIAEGAGNRKRPEALTLEKGKISTEIRSELFGRMEGPRN